ncbi:MAG: hypothetical protein HY880_09380 [Deltaproteobacteria bacterium]|nr:hypothetical protein [Deltaproteobacteria bacterium]
MRVGRWHETRVQGLMLGAFIASVLIFYADKIASAEPDQLFDVKAMDLAAAMDQRSKELDLREEKMLAEEARLKEISGEIDRKIGEAVKDRQALEKMLVDIKKASRDSMNDLAVLYESMPPEEAASSIAKMDNDTALRILKAMKKKQAGKVLGFIAPEKAARLTEEFDRRYIPDKFYEKGLAMEGSGR